MVRRTSVDAYNAIKQNGLLSERRWQTYDVLYKFGPATAMELRKYFPKGHVDSQIRARLNELRELGVAYEVKERPCGVTGHVVIEWDVSDGLPLKRKTIKKTKCINCGGSGYITR